MQLDVIATCTIRVPDSTDTMEVRFLRTGYANLTVVKHINSRLRQMYKKDISIVYGSLSYAAKKRAIEEIMECGRHTTDVQHVNAVYSQAYLAGGSGVLYWFGNEQRRYNLAAIRLDVFLFVVLLSLHLGTIGDLIFEFEGDTLPDGGGVISATENFLIGTRLPEGSTTVLSGEDTFI